MCTRCGSTSIPINTEAIVGEKEELRKAVDKRNSKDINAACAQIKCKKIIMDKANKKSKALNKTKRSRIFRQSY